MRNSEITNEALARELNVLKAIASPIRLQILEDLKDPVKNFPAQVDGDLKDDGVCSDLIRERLGVAAPTASRHLSLLADAGLVVVNRARGWTFYRRDEAAIKRFANTLKDTL